MALTLLATAAPRRRRRVGRRVAGDPKLAAALRTDAFQVQLLTQPAKEARKLAVAELAGGPTPREEARPDAIWSRARASCRPLPNGLFLYGVINSTI